VNEPHLADVVAAATIAGMSTFESTQSRWTRIVQEQAASGLTVAEFCARRGLAVSTFYPWKRRLASEAAQTPRAATPAFVEARIAPAERRPVSADDHGCGVTIVLACGRRVLVAPGFDPRLLLDVLGTLERDLAAAGPTP